ncbi:thioredoxin family protein [Parasediminibacterium sp. JCM 36343]|uniref:thioredoxin family protein n=1 Tax=Parasediminibacterium sp. JCM 36343 TaxID=3374279 RepID=UPI00397A3423
MKWINTILFTSLLLATACLSSKKAMKIDFKVAKDEKKDGHKMLVGIINRAMLQNDTAFGWFKENSQYGLPDATAVKTFRLQKAKFSMVVFGGTWCEDTQNLLPKFYQLLDASGYPESQITLIAVDRKKETIHNLHTTYHINNVPTFIVLKDGKEAGRVVEYGTMGDITKELGMMVARLEK